MKTFCFKCAVVLSAISLGLTGVWLGDAAVTFSAPALDRIFLAMAKSSQKNEAEVFPKSTSGKIELRLRRIYQKGETRVAEFALVNGTSESISYMGYGKNSYCSITYRQGEDLKTTHGCTCGTGLALQVLPAGETALYTVSDTIYEDFSGLKSQKLVTASFGFEFLIGAEKRREQLWTEEISFHPDTQTKSGN